MAPMSRPPLKTLNGSVIQRHDPVGKKMASRIYVHRDYATLVLSAGILGPLQKIVRDEGFTYNCIAFDTKDLSCVRFDSAPGFKTDREPIVGGYIWVNNQGVFRRDFSNAIWHHKWQWVLDDYRGFDVTEAYEWSRTWLAHVKGPAKGFQGKWQAQLEEAGIES